MYIVYIRLHSYDHKYRTFYDIKTNYPSFSGGINDKTSQRKIPRRYAGHGWSSCLTDDKRKQLSSEC